MSAKTVANNRIYGTPMAPLVQSYDAPAAADLRRFRAVWAGYGAGGLSWWSWQGSSAAAWSVLSEPPPAAAALPDPGWPALNKGSSGDQVIWMQQHLASADPSVALDGKFSAATQDALKAFQVTRGLAPTGETDAATWQALLMTGQRRASRGRVAAPMATASQPPSRRLSRPLLLALCAAAAAAGCGGQDVPSDKEQVEAAVKRVMESENVADQCETGVSERFVREVYVTLAQCRRANAPVPEEADSAPDSAQISATRIAGDSATTGVTLTSAMGARATGRLALVRVGSTWKVDRLGVDFLRSAFATLPKEGDTAEERRVLGCLAQATRALPDAIVRRIGNLVVGQRLTEAALPARVVLCIREGAPQPPAATT